MKITVSSFVVNKLFKISYTTTNGVEVNRIHPWPIAPVTLDMIQKKMDKIPEITLKEWDFPEKDFHYEIIDDKSFKVSFTDPTSGSNVRKDYVLPLHDSIGDMDLMDELKSIYHNPQTIIRASESFERMKANTQG
jgi:hypothetical protein